MTTQHIHHCFSPSYISNKSTALLPWSTMSTVRVATRGIASKKSQTGCLQATVDQLQEKAVTAVKETETTAKVSAWNEMKQLTEVIKDMLHSMDDGNLSVSPYDTAWVALVKDINGRDAPQFPSSLEWILNNQLPDGSWGENSYFSPYDRLSCTIACVVALATWNLSPEKCNKGLSFLQQNLERLKDEDPEHMPSGFEFRFPSLIEMAHKLGLEISKDSKALQDLCAIREAKLKRIPKEMLHSVPTTLLYSLEGMPGLEWDRLLKLQHPNGSFLCSTGSTAYALAQSKDRKCLEYLQAIVKKFNGGVPHTYPADIFERLWVVDRLERLGFSRYFKSEIKEILDYVHGYWTPNGLSWARNTVELDIDDTSMGFRAMRLHGYEVTASAYHHFEKDGEFFCFVGQNSQGVTEMLSLFRASQILFPGETILEEAKKFSSNFLREKHDLGQDADRWLITKDLVGEVRYYLDVPWYANLPRLETRYYIDVYGGEDDIWVGKVLYRMYNVSNRQFLELAKLDFNQCQELHQKEWIDMQRWYKDFNLSDFGLGEDALLKHYFLVMSNIFEPERATERLAGAQTAALKAVVSSYFKSISTEKRKDFIQAFNKHDCHLSNRSSDKLIDAVLKTLSGISLKVWKVHGREVQQDLKEAWNAWMLSWQTQENNHLIFKDEAELLARIINVCSGYSLAVDLTTQPAYVHLTNLSNEICNRLQQMLFVEAEKREYCIEEVELQMQELVQRVVNRNDGVNPEIKHTYLNVAKSYYYSAYCEPATINQHIAKVLFDRVL